MADGVKKINEWIMKDGRTITVTRDIDPNKLEGGTQFVNPSTGLLNYNNISNTGAKSWKKYDPMVIFEALSIKTNIIDNLTITTEKVNNAAIITSKLKDLNVTTEKISDLCITTIKLADSAVINIKIADNAVTRNKIMDYEVVLSKLAESSVNADKIVPESIINSNIANRTIMKEKMVSKTLTNQEIADLTLIESLYGAGSVSTRALTDRNVTAIKIQLKNVLREHVSAKAIGAAEIDLNCISTDHINFINAIKLVDNSINEIKMNINSISNRTLINACVSYEKLDANLKDLSDRSVRVEKEQTIDNNKLADTAWIKGHVVIKQPAGGNANLTVQGNITATGTVTATKCYNPVFADLAEAYVPTEKMEAGDAVALSLDGGLKVEKLTEENQSRFLGFISNEYATVFGAYPEELKSGKKVAITLVGRIKIKAKGSANIGDYIFIVHGEPRFYSQRGINAYGRVLENKCDTDLYVLCQLWP